MVTGKPESYNSECLSNVKVSGPYVETNSWDIFTNVFCLDVHVLSRIKRSCNFHHVAQMIATITKERKFIFLLTLLRMQVGKNRTKSSCTQSLLLGSYRGETIKQMSMKCDKRNKRNISEVLWEAPLLGQIRRSSLKEETFELRWREGEGCQAEKEGSKVKGDATLPGCGGQLESLEGPGSWCTSWCRK